MKTIKRNGTVVVISQELQEAQQARYVVVICKQTIKIYGLSDKVAGILPAARPCYSTGMCFAMVNDPDGNIILLSGDLAKNKGG